MIYEGVAEFEHSKDYRLSDYGAYTREGQVSSDGQTNGFARHISSNSHIYEGYFLNGELHGFGRLICFDGDYYEGQWRHGLMDG